MGHIKAATVEDFNISNIFFIFPTVRESEFVVYLFRKNSRKNNECVKVGVGGKIYSIVIYQRGRCRTNTTVPEVLFYYLNP